MKNKSLLILCALTSCQPEPDCVIAAVGGPWQFATDENDRSIDNWRKEANYWYDECAAMCDEGNSGIMSFEDKLKFFEENNSLDSKNQQLEEKSKILFPEWQHLKMFELENKLSAAKKDLWHAQVEARNVNDPFSDIIISENQLEVLKDQYANLEKTCIDWGFLVKPYCNKSPQDMMLEELEAERNSLLKQLKNAEHFAQQKSIDLDEFENLKSKTKELEATNEKLTKKLVTLEEAKRLENNNKNKKLKTIEEFGRKKNQNRTKLFNEYEELESQSKNGGKK